MELVKTYLVYLIKTLHTYVLIILSVSILLVQTADLLSSIRFLIINFLFSYRSLNLNVCYVYFVLSCIIDKFMLKNCIQFTV